jgi:hypothetical protein
MSYFKKSHPIIGSFVAAAVPFLPAVTMSLHALSVMPSGIVDVNQPGDGGRSDALVVLCAPVFYIFAVPMVYGAGKALESLGLKRLSKFLAGMAAIALILAICVGLLIGALSHLGIIDTAGVVALCAGISLFTALPSGLCWWFFTLRPKTSSLH